MTRTLVPEGQVKAARAPHASRPWPRSRGRGPVHRLVRVVRDLDVGGPEPAGGDDREAGGEEEDRLGHLHGVRHPRTVEDHGAQALDDPEGRGGARRRLGPRRQQVDRRERTAEAREHGHHDDVQGVELREGLAPCELGDEHADEAEGEGDEEDDHRERRTRDGHPEQERTRAEHDRELGEEDPEGRHRLADHDLRHVAREPHPVQVFHPNSRKNWSPGGRVNTRPPIVLTARGDRVGFAPATSR